MDDNQFAPGITGENLRDFLELWPLVMAEGEEALQLFKADNESGDSAEENQDSAWCYLYELPIKEHQTLALAGIVQNLGDFLSVEQLKEWFGQIIAKPGQIGAVPTAYSRIDEYFDALPNPEGVAAETLRSNLPSLMGLALSMVNTLRSVLYFGCFLNELIDKVRAGDDDALFSAVRLDVTTLGNL